MTKPTLPKASSKKTSKGVNNRLRATNGKKNISSKSPEETDVLISAVISTYLLSHLHHVLQRAEFGAVQEGRGSKAANYAQLRKVLCMDARSMEDAWASGMKEKDFEQAA